MNVKCDNCGMELNIIPGGSQFMVGEVLREPEGYVIPPKIPWWKPWRFLFRAR
jgi:hypothetical protein